MDENTVAITINLGEEGTGSNCGINIINIRKKKATQYIALPEEPFGISYNGTALICCVLDKNIHVISCTDYKIDTVPNTVLPKYSYVSAHADKIMFTNGMNHKVLCCLYDGTPVWEFTEEVLRSPRGITVDDRGNIFVIGCMSGNVISISPDGKQFTQILNMENGLNIPCAVFF